MQYSSLIFSPTGGTSKVVEALVASWGEAVQSVDLTDIRMEFQKVRFGPDDTVVIAVPSYGGRVPGLAAERIAEIRGNGARAVLVCVYGNRAYEDTLTELEDLVKRAGFAVTAAVAAIAEHSVVRRFARNRPDPDDKNTLADYSKKILEKLLSGGEYRTVLIPGSRPYKKAAGVEMQLETGDACSRCGLCAAKCPAGAIDKDNVKAIDKTKCISCMRCITICPQQAKAVDKTMLTAVSTMLQRSCSDRKPCELFL